MVVWYKVVDIGRAIRDIVQLFKHNFRSAEEEDSLDQPSYRDKMEMWRRNLEDQSDKEDIEPPTILELDEETIHDPLMPNLQAYREAIFKSPSYEWLTGSLRRDFLLIPADPDCMEIIRKEIAHAFPSSRQVSRKKVAGDFYVAFQVGWDPLAFIAEQEYPAQPGDSVLNALTITGPNTEAQALPCSQYIYQTWSVTGKLIMKFLGRVASDARGGRMTRHTGKHIDNVYISPGRDDLFPRSRNNLEAWINKRRFILLASGTVDSLVEIGQQLGWLGAALRSSPFETGMAFCKPYIRKLSSQESGRIFFRIDFVIETVQEDLKPSNCQCLV